MEKIKKIEWYLTEDDVGHFEISKNVDIRDVLVVINALVHKFGIIPEAMFHSIYSKERR